MGIAIWASVLAIAGLLLLVACAGIRLHARSGRRRRAANEQDARLAQEQAANEELRLRQAEEDRQAEARSTQLRKEEIKAARQKYEMLRREVQELDCSEYLGASDVLGWQSQHPAAVELASAPYA